MALGPVLGGLFIGFWGEQDGIRLAFVAALLLSIVAAALQQVLIEDDPPELSSRGPSPRPEKNPMRLFRQMSPSLKRLLISDILVRFCEQIPYAFVVVWCMKTIAAPVTALQFGILTVIEMITALLIEVPRNHSLSQHFVFLHFFHLCFYIPGHSPGWHLHSSCGA
jgi:MFS family permease